MKRISFKDSGGLNLTQAVLSGRKTMTRRIAYRNDVYRIKYKVGDTVAIQQAYRDIPAIVVSSSYACHKLSKSAGWRNKMFVKAELMPHHIRITDVRVEWLQDISDEDCMREGIDEFTSGYNHCKLYNFAGDDTPYIIPRAAFAALIDKVSGCGTWQANPLVWVYSFELVD